VNQSSAPFYAASALALYLVVLAGALDVPFGASGWLMAASAVWAAFARTRGVHAERERAPRLVLALLRAGGLAVAALLTVDAHSLLGELALAVSLPVIGYSLVELALTTPDTPPRLVRQLGALPLLTALSFAVALVGAFAAAPPVSVLGRALIAPYVLVYVPPAYAFGCGCLALAIRASRRRFGSDTRAVSANGWPTAGLMLGTLVSALGVAAYAIRFLPLRALGVVLALVAVVVGLGHALLVSPQRSLVAAPWVRGLIAHGVALVAGVVVAAVLVRPLMGLALYPLALGAAAAAAYALLFPVAGRIVYRLLAPHRARLLAALDEIRCGVVGSVDVPELVARVLKPLRVAAGSPEAAPLLFVSDPEREYRLDAAGIARVSERALPRSLSARFADHPSAPLVTSDVRGLLPRRPELRELLATLDELRALAVLPLVIEGNREGVIVLPRGARRSALRLEELLALEELVHFVAPLLAAALSVERSLGRARSGDLERDALKAEVDERRERERELGAELAAVRSMHGEGRVVREPVAYSDAMRALLARLDAASAHDLPLLFVGEAGVDVRELCEYVHRRSGREGQAFVAIDCAAMAEGEHVALLLGGAERGPARPGWLGLASEGTLYLADVGALSLTAQRMLAEALSERLVRPVGASAARPLTARVLASVRRPLGELVEDGRIVSELARWLAGTSYGVPPLRERTQDLESLILRELDRAARVVGRETPGLAPDVRHALLEHTWPGNQAELSGVIERAVAKAQGLRITRDELPPLAAPSAEVGSFVDQEREILARALERAGGNRTQAARALGLKRQTLVEKLRKHGLDSEPGGARH
jgi:DNA-binding NtrC family response regulator